MKSNISALMDGELQDTEHAVPLRALHEDETALQAWREYHIVGDALRGTRTLSADFSARVAARLAEEPTVLAPPRAARAVRHNRRWMALSAAASLAAVGLVGWLAFALQRGAVPDSVPLAQIPQAVQTRPAEVRAVPLPSGANDYLLAHQTYSPRSGLQGVAPYVRTVSERGRPR